MSAQVNGWLIIIYSVSWSPQLAQDCAGNFWVDASILNLLFLKGIHWWCNG